MQVEERDESSEVAVVMPQQQMALPQANSASNPLQANRSILEKIDNDIARLKCGQWMAVLPFDVEHVVLGDTGAGCFTEYDLFKLADSMHKGTIARFDPKKYPVVAGGMNKNMRVWGKLCSDLIVASKEHGNCRLTSNGNKHGKMFLHCSNFKFYPESLRIKKFEEGEYRKHTINGDKNNARKGEDSKKLKKKTSTSKPLKANNNNTCKVRLIIGIDLCSFFLFWKLSENALFAF
jgi:hypothetical protein